MFHSSSKSQVNHIGFPTLVAMVVIATCVVSWLVAFCIIRNDTLELERNTAEIQGQIDTHKLEGKMINIQISKNNSPYHLREQLVAMSSQLKPIQFSDVETISNKQTPPHSRNNGNVASAH